ncbi:MAG: hypothetical protein LBC61_00495 [Candidatus Peribacteria bacterium]|jgi:hypothetical protein|nr:hypothetical protein [Candidatus Peribacteria bacterium]
MVFKAKNCHQIPGCIPINENDRDVTEATIRKFTVRNKDNMQRSYKIAGERALANANKECNE